jgi:hypothetical protein
MMRLPSALVLCLASARCVFNTEAGSPCENSRECIASVCVVVDATEGEESICVPHTELNDTPCDEAAVCVAAGWPVEATCEDGLCTCLEVPDSCGFGFTFDPATCTCELSS